MNDRQGDAPDEAVLQRPRARISPEVSTQQKTIEEGQKMTKRTTDDGSGLLCAVAIVLAAIVLATSVRVARAGETPVYGPDGKYQGSVHDYARTQTYTDRSGHFTGSAINNGNGTTSFFNRNGNFIGSAGSSIDRALNFGRVR